MGKIVYLNVAAVLAAVAALSTAGPAAADSSSCTHHLSGPQICIRLEGNNFWNTPTAIWTNPGRKVMAREVSLFVNGKRYYGPRTATRKGKTLSYSWGRFQQDTDTQLCVRFAGIDRVACEFTRDIGDRAQF
ncbi:hypothetical protein ACIPJK_35720 [Streptomyces roseus]|uniref:hypothetical protein n=1 Tax=Streptomyces roseus TaxID=66430 RepID=UPI003822DD82